MGGNTLKTITTRRYSKEEYFEAVSKLTAKLNSLKTTPKYRVIKAYHTKETYGDMDVIFCESDTFKLSDLKSLIVETFQPDEIVRNDKEYHFNFGDLQVDFTLVEEELFDLNYHYQCYNELGNLLGYLAKCVHPNFTFGTQGLYYTHTSQILNRSFRYVFTYDFNIVLKFFGLSEERYYQGFDTLEDVYKFILTSKYSIAEKLNLGSRNSAKRRNDQKRPSTMSFFEYVEKNFKSVRKPLSEKEGMEDLDKFSFFLTITSLGEENMSLSSFTNSIEQKEKEKVKYNSILNGKKVSEKLGVSGPNLGIIMKKFNSQFENEEDRIKYVLNTDETDLYAKLEEIKAELLMIEMIEMID